MKAQVSLVLALLATLALTSLPAASAEQGMGTPQAAIECTTDKGNVPTCRKASGTPEASSAARARKQCVFTCKKSHGIWVCKGNGPQCNGKSPWD